MEHLGFALCKALPTASHLTLPTLWETYYYPHPTNGPTKAWRTPKKWQSWDFPSVLSLKHALSTVYPAACWWTKWGDTEATRAPPAAQSCWAQHPSLPILAQPWPETWLWARHFSASVSSSGKWGALLNETWPLSPGRYPMTGHRHITAMVRRPMTLTRQNRSTSKTHRTKHPPPSPNPPPRAHVLQAW